MLSPGWDADIVMGVELSREAKTEKAIADSLINFFLPLEPSLKVTYGKTVPAFPPAMEVKDMVVSKQHQGLELYSYGNPAFKSIRLNYKKLL